MMRDRRLLPHGSAWAGLVFILSAAGALASVRFRALSPTPTQHVALLCAVLCLFWSLVAAAATAHRSRRGGTDTLAVPKLSFISLGRLAAVLFGVVTAIIQAVVQVMRMIYVGVDIVHGYPWEGVRDYGFGPLGLWSLALLFVSNGISWRSTGERRLATVQLWTAVLLVLWSTLLFPPFRMNTSGGFERTEATLLLLAALSVLLTAAVLVDGRFGRERRTEGEAHMVSAHETPGFAASCGVLALLIIILTCYHLLVPIPTPWGGVAGCALWVFFSAAIAAGGCFLLLRRSWSANLADASVGLASLSLCALAMLAVPSLPASLAERYPMMFNAIMVGLAVATGLWTWLAGSWSRELAGGEAWTTRARSIPHVQRFAFLNAALALVVGALMTYWPRLPSIASMDHSLGRITAGLAAHLFLVLVMLWCSRRLRRLTFHLLTVLAVVSTAGFILVRMAPFASRLG